MKIKMVVKFFFFQAEDGIRDWSVTGVQTCALPISVGFPVDAWLPANRNIKPRFAHQYALGYFLTLGKDRKSVV